MAEILKEGMLAEVIVLDRNLFEVKPKEILDTKVLVTIMDGEIIYRGSKRCEVAEAKLKRK